MTEALTADALPQENRFLYVPLEDGGMKFLHLPALVERLLTNAGQEDIEDAARVIIRLSHNVDRWRESSNQMTKLYEHRGRLLEETIDTLNRLRAGDQND